MSSAEQAGPSRDGALRVKDLRKEYPAPARPLLVLDAVHLELEPGQSLAVLGPSGSGKSTLLNILGGLEPPTSGTVRLGATDPYALSEPELARFRNRQVGFVFQDHHLLPQLTALENVLLPALPRADRGSVDYAERGRRLLARVGLAERMDHLPAELSGGERQRAAIARALLGRPALVLADEPTGNLDRRAATEVGDLLLALGRDEGTILVVATHSSELSSRFPRRTELDLGRLREL